MKIKNPKAKEFLSDLVGIPVDTVYAFNAVIEDEAMHIECRNNTTKQKVTIIYNAFNDTVHYKESFKNAIPEIVDIVISILEKQMTYGKN